MREKERLSEYLDSLQGRGSGQSEENERFVNESLEGGAIYGAEGGLRVDIFEHDDPDDDPQCLCDLPEQAQDIIIEEIEHEEGDA